MNFKKTNLIAGWIVGLFACTVYILTSEAGGSFWDCGEFVSSCFKMQVPHPPGAPLFAMLGRIFIVLFGDNPLTAAKAVNVMSALASGFSILFLFWTITHFARKLIHTDTSKELTKWQLINIIAAGTVGALAYTFSDSFWFSAVEGEVYALSSFFTAIVFWGILKWENEADEPGADKWIVFIFFMIGLSIGVHLLCLLCIPAITMAYYFRRRNQFNYAAIRKYFVRTMVVGGTLAVIAAFVAAKSEAGSGNDAIPMDSTVAGLMLIGTAIAIGLLYLVERINKAKKEYYGGAYIFFVLGFVLVGIVQVGVIQYTVKGAGQFDIFFVNSLGFPFFSGFAFFFLLLAVVTWLGLRYAARKGLGYLRLALWCLAFMLIGYSTYITTMIRSSADPSVDMYNVDNPMSLAGYLGREQYGDFPILYGQTFNAQIVKYKDAGNRYQKGDKKYNVVGKDIKYVYAAEDKMIFPRMWDASDDQYHARYYAFFMNIGPNKDGSGYERGPTFGENIKFFLSYQTYFMYIRYFMWNFSGRQNDLEGIFTGNVRDGNWISGISVIDNALYGDQSALPDSLQNNKAHNKMFMLPFIFGLLGLFYHFRKRGDDATINMLLFMSTGLAIVVYLNQPGYQPRERDYAYAASFYAFSVWIGLAVAYFADLASKWDEKLVRSVLTGSGVVALVFLIGIQASGYGGASGIMVAAGVFALVAAIGVGIPYLLKNVKNYQTISIVSIIISLVIPVLMASQEWDDHDRSKKTLPRDLARNYLEGCPPNAILFSFGDNDTYPLWYAQEVEGIRTDVRVINTSLLGIDWYINQLRYKVNASPAIDVIWNASQIEGRKRDYIFYQPQAQFPENRYYDLYDMMKNWSGSDDQNKMVDRGGDFYNTYPVKKVSVPVDANMVRKNGTVNANDSVISVLNFDIPKNALMKNDLAILNILAANKWQRPICFTMSYGELGFQNYLRRNGLVYSLVPIANNSGTNTDEMYNLVTNKDKWAYGNANIPGVYFDEENRRHLDDIREADADVAFNLAIQNKNTEAIKVLQQSDKMMLQENFAYGYTSRSNAHNRVSLSFLQACYKAGEKELAAKVFSSLKKDIEQQKRYYESLSDLRAENMQYEKQQNDELLQQLMQLQQVFNPAAPSVNEKSNPVIVPDSTPK